VVFELKSPSREETDASEAYLQLRNYVKVIARVNRVFSCKIDGEIRQKEGGLVVDYVSIAAALKKAMHDYTNRDKENYSEQEIAKTALPKFLEKLERKRPK
jgi:type I restriction enzyme R subunit